MTNSVLKIYSYALLLFMVNLSAEECSQDAEPWRVVASGSQSKIQEATRQVIQSEEEWQKWWEKHNTVEAFIDGKPVPKPPPTVDFEQETVLAATLGRRSTGGYVIRFTEIDRENEVVTATLQVESPGPEDLVTTALTSPFSVIGIRKHEGRVKFVDEQSK